MGFQGNFSVRAKIVLADTPIEHVTSFKYFSCETTDNYGGDE